MQYGGEVFQHSRAPGERWTICQLCGFRVFTKDARKIMERDHPHYGLIVCKDEFSKKPEVLNLKHLDLREPGPINPELINPEKSPTYLSGPTSGIAPNPPLSLIIMDISSTYVRLTWMTNPGNGSAEPTGYKIEREVYPSGGFTTLVANTGTNENVYIDRAVTVGVSYNYRVSAINGFGTSLPSNEIWGTAR